MPGEYDVQQAWASSRRMANMIRTLQGQTGFMYLASGKESVSIAPLHNPQQAGTSSQAPHQIVVPLIQQGPNPGQAGLYP